MATARLFGQQTLGMRPDDVVYSAAKLFFAYGLGNAPHLSDVGRRHRGPVRRTPDAPTPFSTSCGASSRPFSAAADRLCGGPGGLQMRARGRLAAAAPLPFGRRSLAGAYRDAWKQRFASTSSTASARPKMLHIFLSKHADDIRYGTSGRAVPGYELRLLDEQGREVADDEIGELFVSGPSAAEGYWNQRDKSRSTFGGAWTRTGDKFVRGADGRYTYCGRTDDMFKVSGVWVSALRRFESALLSHPAILEAAVIPSADTDGLLKPKAYVVLKNRQAATISTPRCAST